MSESKYYMYQNDSHYGKVGLNVQVFGSITELALKELPNVRIDLPSRSFLAFGKGPIITEIDQGDVIITIETYMKYGKNINKTSKMVQEKVMNAIKEMTCVSCRKVDVKVIGIDF